MNEIIIVTASYVYLISIVVTVVYFFYTKKEIRRRFAFLSFFTLPLSYITGLLAGFVYYDPRPFVIMHITPLFMHAADNGFPSDHVLLMGTLSAIVTAFNVELGVFLWILAILVGTARVLANVHHLIDIMASIGIAVAVTTLVYFLLKQYQYRVDECIRSVLIALKKVSCAK